MANGAPKLTAQEKEWRAKDDARTLAEAETIKTDKSRMMAAKQAANSMADEAKKRADVMANVANMGKVNNSSSTKGSKTKTKGK